MSLENKIIWITGASSGIGKALALELSKLNCKLILSARNKDRLLAVKNECTDPNNVHIVPFDLENYESCPKIVTSTISLFGKIDILINNGTSVVGKVATPVRSSYSASKHALHGFFDSLRAEVYKDHIDVTLILPGYVRTELSFNALVGDGSRQDKMDVATDNGILPAVFVKKMITAIRKKKREIVIGGLKET